jgi:tetratricopeptide (TPR) repeat protein
MASDAAIRLIEEATHALQSGDANRSLKAAEQAVVVDESIPEAHQLRGIALTRLGRVEEATIAFRRAIELAPYEPKHFYNLAVNLRDRNLADEAESMAREALRIDPSHSGARMLVRELTGTEPPLEAGDAQPVVPTIRQGYEEPLHLLPFMYGMERVWNGIGYGFMALGLLLAVLFVTHYPIGLTGAKVPAGQLPDVGLRRDPLSIFVIYLYVISFISTFMWMLIDIIDRRRRFTWFVPLTVCGTFGFNVLPLAFYFFVGRKLESDGVPKT